MAKVLLVEDDKNLREIFEMRLQAESYETVTAGDGEEALSVALKEKPDLIIADVMMPKLSGFEMIENLRTVPDMANTKVIMMTALGQAEDRTRGENLGVLKYLVKSQVTLEDFVRVVRDVLPPQAYSITNNNQQGGQSMPDDNNTPATNPTDNAAPSAPASDAPAADPAATGQMSTAEEQQSVNQQVNDFVASAPSAPAGDDGQANSQPAAPEADSSSADAPAMPPTSAPSADEGQGEQSQNPAPGAPSGL